MPPRRISREESWQSLRRSDALVATSEDGSTDVSMDDGGELNDNTLQSVAPMFPTVNDVRKALHPLQATADRVGQQVEEFAKSLDRISNKTRKESTGDCRHVLPLVNEYKKIASNTVKSLRAKHGSDRRSRPPQRAKSKSGRSSTRSPGAGALAANDLGNERLTTMDDVRRWEEEEQTWDLLGMMLQVEFPVPENERSALERYMKDTPTIIRPMPNHQLNGYSSEKEVFDNFLASDDLAWERYTVTEWLKRCAEKSRPEIDRIVEELESKADRGSGLWAHSWLYTKEAIKGQKRLRSWPQALEPDSPGLDASMVGSKSKSALVTQLDPDAISRQGRELEQHDKSFERAIWVACWEMLRRGKDWDYVHSWCQDRGELWRSTAMRSDLRLSTASSTNWRSRHLWRKTCAIASKMGGNDDYEKAVYGLLGGYLPSVLNIARGWDDHLFAHYTSYLLHSFERHQKVHYPGRISLPQSEVFRFSAFSGQRTQSGNQIIDKMRQQTETKDEALQHLKMLQGSLVARSVEDFLIKHGVRITRVANAETVSKTILPMPVNLLEASQTANITLEDYDFLRVLTHMIIIYYKMGYEFGGTNRRYAVDSIIVAYIDFLSRAGKQQIIPLYASFLSRNRAIDCMSRQLPFVLDSEERKIMMKLMAQYDMDVALVLATQLRLIMMDVQLEPTSRFSYPKLQLQDPTDKNLSYLHQIRPRFLGDEMTDEQYDLIHGLEWFLLLEGDWEASMYFGVAIYKHFLRRGAYAAGRLLSRSVTFSQFSLSKTQGILGRVTDLSRDQDQSDTEESPRKMSRNTKASISKGGRSKGTAFNSHSKIEREVLLTHGRSYLDFEHLFVAWDAIENWADLATEAEQYVNRQQDARAWREKRAPFQRAFGEVEAAVSRLTHDWLQNPRNETEAKEFNVIRTVHLPEIILAFNTILTFSARYISRNLFIKSMNMAASVAAAGSELSQCFMDADRMPEMVESFAWTSKSMILASNTGRSKSDGKRTRNGESLDIWTVRVGSDDEEA